MIREEAANDKRLSLSSCENEMREKMSARERERGSEPPPHHSNTQKLMDADVCLGGASPSRQTPPLTSRLRLSAVAFVKILSP